MRTVPNFQNKDTHRLYTDLSWIWPIVSPPAEYEEETEFFSKAIKEQAKIKVEKLLHLGCGGGRHDFFYKKYFKVTGVDISKEMIKQAKNLNPEVNYRFGDMRKIRLGEYFDAVTAPDCIQYMLTEDDLRKAFKTAYKHLKPGGIFHIIVEEERERFKQNRTISSVHRQGDVEITFIENSYDPDPSDTIFELTFVFLIRQKGKLRIQTDLHLLGIFEMPTWHRLLKETGFEVMQMRFEHSTFVRGKYFPMLIGLKPLLDCVT